LENEPPTVAGLLPKRARQSAEKSAKRYQQNADSNEINMMENNS